MFTTKSFLALAMAVALPVALESAASAAAIELSPPPPPASPAVSPLDASFPLFIESGSDQAYIDADGNVWRADVGFVGGAITDRGAVEIDGTTDDRIYQTERYGLTGYAVKVPNGTYGVSLHFAETFQDIAGKRIFSVEVEDQKIADLDVFAEADGKNKALVKTFDNVIVSDGELNINFTGKSPIVNGIEIVDTAPAPTVAMDFVGGPVAEDAPAGYRVGTVTASSTGDSAFHYSLIDDADGRFVIDAESGDLTLAAEGVLDYELATSHKVVVSATDAEGVSTEATFTIVVLDVAEHTTELQITHLVPENAQAGATVGVISPIDPHAAPGVSYSLSDDAEGRFTIDAASGKVEVAEDNSLDYEVAPSHVITVSASNSAGLVLNQSFTVELEDINEPPTSVSLSAQSVEDKAPGGTVVGVASATDPDAGETLTYALTDDADGRFAIDAESGVVSVTADAGLDHEAAASHRIVIAVSDTVGHVHSEGFTITVEAPTDLPSGELIEAGSETDYVDETGRRWAADTGFVDGQIVDRGAIEIAGTDNDRIYQTERWGVSAYSLPTASGIYTVKLHFAETSDKVTVAGKRVFSVDVEGQALNDIDVFAAAGNNTALVKTVSNVVVDDGHLDIAFQRKSGEPIIDAIEIEPVLTCAPSAH
ncbi:MAG: cadherin domain-containing protein [Rhodospirillales bacterium]|nr:cadherin domain-containing protein [Rhodospirillales bacterium]